MDKDSEHKQCLPGYYSEIADMLIPDLCMRSRRDRRSNSWIRPIGLVATGMRWDSPLLTIYLSACPFRAESSMPYSQDSSITHSCPGCSKEGRLFSPPWVLRQRRPLSPASVSRPGSRTTLPTQLPVCLSPLRDPALPLLIAREKLTRNRQGKREFAIAPLLSGRPGYVQCTSGCPRDSWLGNEQILVKY